MMYDHCMLDIECLGTTPGAVIVQIGACMFNMRGEHDADTFLRNVDIQSCLNRDMYINGATVEWWFGQSDNARKALFLPPPVPIGQAMEDFKSWYSQRGDPSFIWSNGSDFDIPIMLEAWNRTMPGKAPWPYKGVRCCRTVSWMARHQGWAKEVPRSEQLVKHRADHDAIHQAQWTAAAMKYLREGK